MIVDDDSKEGNEFANYLSPTISAFDRGFTHPINFGVTTHRVQGLTLLVERTKEQRIQQSC